MNDNRYLAVDIANLEAHIAALTAQFPELTEDTELRADMLEGETDINSVLSRLLSQQRHAVSMAKARADRIKDLQSLKAKDDRRDEIMRAMLLRILKAANLPKAQLVEGTVSITKGRTSVEISDEAALPKKFVKVTTTPDKTLIKAELEAGRKVKGAALREGTETLMVRAA